MGGEHHPPPGFITAAAAALSGRRPPLFMPVLSAMSAMHSGGCSTSVSRRITLSSCARANEAHRLLHRAVRQADTDLAQNFTAAAQPLESSTSWITDHRNTDVYGFTACLFYALTGVLPKDALQRRTDGRLLIPTPAIMRKIPPHVVTALANGLRVTPEKRTPTFERLRGTLRGADHHPVIREVEARCRRFRKHAKKKSGLPNAAIWAFLCARPDCFYGCRSAVALPMRIKRTVPSVPIRPQAPVWSQYRVSPGRIGGGV